MNNFRQKPNPNQNKFVEKRLVEYIRNEIANGIQIEKIKQNLRKRGWNEYNIVQAINIATQPIQVIEPQPSSKKKWGILTILIFIALGSILFLYYNDKGIVKPSDIEVVSPDVLEYYVTIGTTFGMINIENAVEIKNNARKGNAVFDVTIVDWAELACDYGIFFNYAFGTVNVFAKDSQKLYISIYVGDNPYIDISYRGLECNKQVEGVTGDYSTSLLIEQHTLSGNVLIAEIPIEIKIR